MVSHSNFSGTKFFVKTRMSKARVVAFLGLALMVPVLGACTTVEGTNAFVDVVTFEREVMSSTFEGLGLLERVEKEEIETPRSPLVMPNQTASLPSPTVANLEALPVDSDTVQIDLTGMSEADLNRLRNARVVDLSSFGGRPLTESETRQLAARMSADTRIVNGVRPLYLPPEHYFTTVGDQDLICLAPNGDLVPLEDPRCPPAIRAALSAN